MQRKVLLELNEKRNKIEKEMIEIVELLENMNGKPGLKNRLIDDEGFPRDDVDIFEARKLRNRHACLQTDHKTLMKDLENRLYGLHKIYIEKKSVDPIQEQSNISDTQIISD